MALMRIDGIGPVMGRTIISKFGSVRAVMMASRAELFAAEMGGRFVDRIMRGREFAMEESVRELRFIGARDVDYYLLGEPDYPRALAQIPDAPLVLFGRGNMDLNAQRYVAMVGTRDATSYGLKMCEKIVGDLARYDVTIVSGLAYGIDICAHRACLDQSIPTIGVLAHGLDRIYPSVHKKVAKQMEALGGLVTEFPSGTNPDRENFPKRNRIVAGLCEALIVVESRLKGGSLITARMANGYDRDVFAVPGRLTDKGSAGTNELIRRNGAFLFNSVDELANVLRWKPVKSSNDGSAQFTLNLDPIETKIVDHIKWKRHVDFDQLLDAIGLSRSELSMKLLTMQLSGIINVLPGNSYELA